jgi:hypothetical protein
MASQGRCHCQSCTIRSLTGPAVVITIGILFLLHQLRGGEFYFGHTWPVILVVIGLVQLATATASREGHVEPVQFVPVPGVLPAPPNSGVPPVPPATGTGTSQPPYTTSGQ